jgi:uncharacterized delta-60 repeat protein
VIVLAIATGCGGEGGAGGGAGFDDAGKVPTDFGGDDVANALAIQRDGKMVAAGRKGRAFALARYTPDGRLDESFGAAGKVVTDFGVARADKCVEPCQHGAAAVAIQGDGKIVAAGGQGSDFALARYLPDGRLDPSFGRGGKVVTDVGARPDRFEGRQQGANAIAIQSDGKIIAAGAGAAGRRRSARRRATRTRSRSSGSRSGTTPIGTEPLRGGSPDLSRARRCGPLDNEPLARAALTAQEDDGYDCRGSGR